MSFEKDLGHLSDEVLRGMDSNVLIVVDTSNQMVSSLAGMLPTFRWTLTGMVPSTTTPDHAWMRANQPGMMDADFRARLLAQNTYGTGTRRASTGTAAAQNQRFNPPAGQMFGHHEVGTENMGVNANRWGRDVNPFNNIIGDPNSYYSPNPSMPFLLTFKDVNWSRWSGVGPVPNSASNYVVPQISLGPGVLASHPAGVNIRSRTSSIRRCRKACGAICPVEPTTGSLLRIRSISGIWSPTTARCIS